MHIEDLIILLSLKCQMNPFDSKVVYSFHDQISRGSGFTEKQSQLAIKIVKRHLVKLSNAAGVDVLPFVENPTFRLDKRTVMTGKRVSIIPHSIYTKAIKVEFPYNESLVEKIRKERSNLSFAAWDKDEKAWIFALSERAIDFLSSLFDPNEVILDEEFEKYLKQVENTKNNLDSYVPVLSVKENKPVILNVPGNTPQPSEESIVDALFFARQVGVNTWDESVTLKLSENLVSPLVSKFLDTLPNQSFELNLEENSFFEIDEIVKNLLPSILYSMPLIKL